MRTPRTRQDLIDLAARYAPTQACVTSIKNDGASVIGGFNPVDGLPGWIVTVRSKYGKEWVIAIRVDEQERKLRVRYLDEVPWANWIGGKDGRNPVLDGDDPIGSAYKRTRSLLCKCPLFRKNRSTSRSLKSPPT